MCEDVVPNEGIGAEFFVGHKKYFKLYDTYKMFDT